MVKFLIKAEQRPVHIDPQVFPNINTAAVKLPLSWVRAGIPEMVASVLVWETRFNPGAARASA
ncbi:MAG: hypothetical protein ACOYM5_11515 [Caulobacter sp.]